MPWAKHSDNSATHRLVMAVLALGPQPVPGGTLDPWESACLVDGLVRRCANQSAGQTQDYFTSDGDVLTLGGPNGPRWAAVAAKAGFWKRSRKDGVPGWLLVEDEDYVHMRKRAELAWEKQRKADNANTRLTVPVRLRDGDGCRYCGTVVNWRHRRGNRFGTYDHRTPGVPARSPEDLVVACGACNGERGKDPEADLKRPLQPVPINPYYSDDTVEFLKNNGGIDVPSSERSGSQPGPALPRSRSPRDTAPSDPAQSGKPHRAQRDDVTPPSDPALSGGTPHRPADPADRRAPERVGSRAGSQVRSGSGTRQRTPGGRSPRARTNPNPRRDSP